MTLQEIVESIESQLKPHLTEDVKIHRPLLIEMINHSRAAMIRKLFNSNDTFLNYMQEMKLESQFVDHIEDNGVNIKYDYPVQVIELPSNLMIGAGKRNVMHLGSLDNQSINIDYCSFNEFKAYGYHRFGSQNPAFTILDKKIIIRNANDQSKWMLIAINEYPEKVEGFDYFSSRYPISLNDLRQLEMLTFNHLAPKMGLPVDLLNSGTDETLNAPVNQQVNTSRQMDQESQQIME